jgi:hypothetical protein
MSDSVARGQERSARKIDGEGVKAARGSGGFRRLDGGGAGGRDYLEAGLGQPARGMASEKAARSGDQHAHGRSAHGSENFRHRDAVRRKQIVTAAGSVNELIARKCGGRNRP